MAGNSFGTLFTLTTFGESHGPALGGILDGCPAGLPLDQEFVRSELERRRPGQSELTSPRKEADEVEWLSGVFNGLTTGTPIAFLIRNTDHHSGDYDGLKDLYRPGHADEVWDAKYGFRDHRGSGRASARETIARVVGGAIAKLFLHHMDVDILAWVSSVKDVELKKKTSELDLSLIENSPVRCPDPLVAAEMETVIRNARDAGDSVGGTITCLCKGLPPGLGAPVFDKLTAVLAHAMMSINAAQGFEFDGGFERTHINGSENNPIPSGVSGGLSTGHDLQFRIAFKPVSTIAKAQHTRDRSGKDVILEARGRHDPCVLPRAVPIVEAMAALALADAVLLARADRV